EVSAIPPSSKDVDREQSGSRIEPQQCPSHRRIPSIIQPKQLPKPNHQNHHRSSHQDHGPIAARSLDQHQEKNNGREKEPHYRRFQKDDQVKSQNDLMESYLQCHARSSIST